MYSLNADFQSLDGEYSIVVRWDDKDSTYSIVSSIDGIDKEYEKVEGEKHKEFVDKFGKVKLKLWNKKYEPTGSEIQDAVKWHVDYADDNFVIHSSGVEGYWPYDYDDLIKALAVYDEDCMRFLSNKSKENK